MDFFSRFFHRTAINQLEPDQVQALAVQHPKPYVLDVRTPAEYKQGHIQGAELIPLEDLDIKITRLPKGREIICVCASGSRSGAAARRLNAQGYKASNMKGGMSRWVRAGLPVKAGMGR